MGTVGFREPVPPMVSAWTRGWGFLDEGVAGTAPASAVWDGGNVGVWEPVYVPTTCIATRMWWVNGTSTTGNVEAGLYYDNGRKPGGKYWTSGSVAQGTASQVQFVDIDPDIRLDVGVWWLYMSVSSTTSTFLRSSLNSFLDELLKFYQASVGPGSAPDPATPVESNSSALFIFGFSTNTVT